MNKLFEQTADTTKENSTGQVLETIEFTETIDLTSLAGDEGYIEVELPNFHQKLLELQAENKSATTKNIQISLTNSEGESFGGQDLYPPDWIMIAWFIENQDVEISRVTFWASAYEPFLNIIRVYFYYPPTFPPDYESWDEVGRINWSQIDESLWPSYWTKDVKLAYNLELES